MSRDEFELDLFGFELDMFDWNTIHATLVNSSSNIFLQTFTNNFISPLLHLACLNRGYNRRKC